MSEVETARALALMMREGGIQSLRTPEGYELHLAPVAPARPKAGAFAPSKPIEPPTEKQLAEEEEAMLFAHLG